MRRSRGVISSKRDLGVAKAYLSQCARVDVAKPAGQGPPPGLTVRSERIVEHELEGLRKHARRAKARPRSCTEVEFVDVLPSPAYAANKTKPKHVC